MGWCSRWSVRRWCWCGPLGAGWCIPRARWPSAPICARSRFRSWLRSSPARCMGSRACPAARHAAHGGRWRRRRRDLSRCQRAYQSPVAARSARWCMCRMGRVDNARHAPTFVSVYIPTHERRALLERALHSVLAQSWPHFEVIVVDDGSRDGTREWLQAFASDPRVRAFHSDTPRGAQAARNFALAQARFDLVTGLDDDDTWLPDRLRQLVEALHPGVGFVAAADVIERDDGTRHLARRPARITRDMLLRRNVVGSECRAQGRRACLRRVRRSADGLAGLRPLDSALRPGGRRRGSVRAAAGGSRAGGAGAGEYVEPPRKGVCASGGSIAG